VANNVKMVD